MASLTGVTLDAHILHSLNAFAAHHDDVEDPARSYAIVSEPLFLAAVAAMLVAGWRRAAVSALGAAGLALALAKLAGTIWDRPRPFAAHQAHAFLAHAADSSFPSDHATAAFAIAVAVFLRHRVAGWVLLAAAVVLSTARVALGAHYPSDVLAGALLGSATALVLWAPPLRERLDRLADALPLPRRVRPA